VLDQTKGPVSVCCGPYKTSLSNTDLMVTYDPITKRFVPAGNQQGAIQSNISADKGYYVVLRNPSKNGRQPDPGKNEAMPVDGLSVGQTENHPGPWSHPLWPGQVATVIKGHQLRSNQYLMVSIVDDEAAKANWDKSVVKGAAGNSGDGKAGNVLGINKDELVTGQLIIIKGTSVAFYIPPTGVEVLKDENDRYVRDAVTLERLEYAVLLDESGNKEYVKGPAVVFPTPTQEFFTKDTQDGASQRKFRAYELQPNNGVHIKVIADYEDEAGRHSAGDEMFITGSDMPIYYPREEHAIIKYGSQDKTYAVAIPSGEGRYVLDRNTGEIELVTGPAMFLPNPIKQVIVRRVLSPSECDLYYPGNRVVRDINQSLRSSQANSINGVVESEMERSFASAAVATSTLRRSATANAFADQLERGTTYTPPRTITLDTKYDGAVNINVWSGYAVQVVNSRGERRTVIGPQSVLLEYDEYLEKLSLSTGTPKSDEQRLNTPYLRHISNPVSDVIALKTHDLVNVEVQVKYLVRFDPNEMDRWFTIDNYIQYMVDHLRSLIGNTVRNISVQDFYTDATSILRDLVLGAKDDKKGRPLKHFVENGMTVYDLEVIKVTVLDRSINEMLSNSRQQTLSEKIELDRASARLEITRGIQAARRDEAQAVSETELLIQRLKSEENEAKSRVLMASVTNDGEIQRVRKANEKASAELDAAVQGILQAIEQDREAMEQRFKDLDAERSIKVEEAMAAAHKVRMDAIGPKLIEAMTAMAQTGQLEAIAEHLAPLSIVQGESLSGTFTKLLRGTPLEGMLKNIEGLSIGRAA
jgi:major vault protein